MNLSDEETKEIYKFMGKMDEVVKGFDDLKEEVGHMRKDLDKVNLEFSSLKGKLVAVAAVITFAINALWSVIKGAIT